MHGLDGINNNFVKKSVIKYHMISRKHVNLFRINLPPYFLLKMPYVIIINVHIGCNNYIHAKSVKGGNGHCLHGVHSWAKENNYGY